MIRLIKNILKRKTGETSSNIILIDESSDISKARNCLIKNTSISLKNSSKVILHEDVIIDGYVINLEKGILEIKNSSRLIKGNQNLNPYIDITNGKLEIGRNNVIRCNFSIRFEGQCSIGEYNAINEETEIRCDEKITIGNFNMISYQCMIYDTNTHYKYPVKVRREYTISDFPFIGVEREKPITKEVTIGNDNWFGKRSVVLRGCKIGNEVTIGTNSVASNIEANNASIFGNPGIVVVNKSL